MASSSGSASVTPMPRRNVRRGSASSGDEHRQCSSLQFVQARPAPQLAARPVRPPSSASGTACWSRSPIRSRKPVLPRAAASRMIAAHRRHVVRRQPAAERIGQQVLGHRPDEHLRPPEQRLAQLDDAVDVGAVGQLRASRRSRAAVARRARRRSPSKFSSASPIGSISLWQLAHAGLRAVLLHPLPHRQRAAPVLASRRAAARWPAAAAAAIPSSVSSTHLPRFTGEVRFGCDVTGRMLPWPSRPRRASSVTRDAAEVAAGDAGDAVVARQPLVDERVVRGAAARGRCGPRAGGW